MMTDRMPEIQAIKDEITAARAAAIDRVKALQAGCRHEKIVEGSNRRICACCGVEEFNLSSWPGHTYDGGYYKFVRPAGERTILNSEYVKRGDVTACRVEV